MDGERGVPVITGNVVVIKKVDDNIYSVDIAETSGVIRTYEFRYLAGSRVPVIEWSEAFDAEVETLTEPGQTVAPVVLAFHHLAQREFCIKP